MKLTTINIASTDPEMLYVTKHNIETERIKKDKEYQRTTLSQFINQCNVTNAFVDKDSNFIAFGILRENEDDIYLFVSDVYEKEVWDNFVDTLIKIDFDLSKLHQVSLEALYTGKMQGIDHFVIDNKNYTVKNIK